MFVHAIFDFVHRFPSHGKRGFKSETRFLHTKTLNISRNFPDISNGKPPETLPCHTLNHLYHKSQKNPFFCFSELSICCKLEQERLGDLEQLRLICFGGTMEFVSKNILSFTFVPLLYNTVWFACIKCW